MKGPVANLGSFGIPLAKRLQEMGLMPPNCVRFILDSGLPGNVMKIHFECLADREMIEVLAAEITEVPRPDASQEQPDGEL